MRKIVKYRTSLHDLLKKYEFFAILLLTLLKKCDILLTDNLM